MNLYFVAGRAVTGLKMEKYAWFFVFAVFYIAFFLFWHNYKVGELKKKLKKAEEPIEIWCPMRGEEFEGYAARVMITRHGMELPPPDSGKRQLERIANLEYVTPLTAPSWKRYPSQIGSSCKKIILFEAIYSCPKKNVSGQ